MLMECGILWRSAARQAWRASAAALLACGLSVNAVQAQEPSPASQSAPAISEASFNELVREARAALEAGAYDRAIEAYRAAAELKPDAAEPAYNEGVAHYRKGDFRKAAELFTQALGTADAALSARSKFNLGNCAYAEALNNVRQAQGGDPTAAPNLLKSAATGVKEAAGHYREALAAAPDDADARANLELSHRLLKLIEEMQKQMPQSPSSQPNEQQEQQQEQQQQESQSQQSDESSATTQPSEAEQSQATQPSSQPSEEEPQPQPTSAPASQPQESPSPDEESAEEQQQPPQTQPAASQPQDEDDRRSLSRAEAERLLQLIRDKERQRRLEQARRAQMKKEPVKKDW